MPCACSFSSGGSVGIFLIPVVKLVACALPSGVISEYVNPYIPTCIPEEY